MNTPHELSQLLVDTEKTIDQHGELPAANRLILHRAMDALLTNIHSNAGHYTRAKLGVVCGYSSLFLLDVYQDRKSKATQLLQHAELMLQGKYDPDTLEIENETQYADSVNLMNLEKPFVPAIYASFACSAAVNIVLYDSDFETLGISEKIAAPSDWDASFYASIAHCGGAVWEGVGDNQIRKSFWLWYLHQAIPFAWDTSQPASAYPRFTGR